MSTHTTIKRIPPFTSTNNNKKTPKPRKPIRSTTPPSEETIAALNQLARSRPFCHPHKAKKYDPL